MKTTNSISQQANAQSSMYSAGGRPFPEIIRDIFIETHKDFMLVPTQLSDLSTLVAKTLKEVLAKKTLDIEEASIILKYVLRNACKFKNKIGINVYALANNTLTYYEIMHTLYFTAFLFQRSQQTIVDSIECEHFILAHYITTNYSIINLDEWLSICNNLK